MGQEGTWKSFSDKDLAHFEQRLLEERKRLLRELGHSSELFNAASTAADGDLTNYPFHMADQGTDTMEQEKGFMLASQETHILRDTDDALRRLYAEPARFGQCESCGGRISFERLDAVPHARRCMGCMRTEGGTGPTDADVASPT